MFDHISIGVHDLKRAAAFYNATLAPLGFVRAFINEKGAGWDTPAGHYEPPFAVVQEPAGSAVGSTSMGHIAFKAPSRAAVTAFYEAAMANGAVSQHAPRVWTEYGPDYFAAFVEDPDGCNIEAVCHLPAQP
ncbi:MAG: VOC family protein [Elusimicrobiales bacterium]|nr:VOC family protein [Elusimicrobiales bacterium]